MKQIEKIAESANFSAVNLGELNEVRDYSLIHPVSKKNIEGKVFKRIALNFPEQSFSIYSFLPM